MPKLHSQRLKLRNSKNENFMLFEFACQKPGAYCDRVQNNIKTYISINIFITKWFQNCVTTHSASPFLAANLCKTRGFCQMDRKLENTEQV